MQDFSNTSEIDWMRPISEIDRQLYTKYGLTENEISIIEKSIKSVEDSNNTTGGRKL